ncbi:MAG: hypothetical protein FJX74_06005 [Armatimonadetes bacterium]|nr:hypothetical protein [Armatimonadota bacterium]
MRSPRPSCVLFLTLGVLVCAVVASAQPNKPLLAHWTFDEVFGRECVDASGNGVDASPQGAPNLVRAMGVFGNAMVLQGTHLLGVQGKPDLNGLRALSLSVWALPTDLSVYRELFRKEDGDNRVLFSFQHDGAILSLGLNVGGYVECDAKIEPGQVLDGRWHHCAATFDGQTMRVYLDGKEVGALARPGVISAGGPAAGCIGSSNGGECFQGALDDLRLYAAALTAEEVAQLHAEGLRALAASPQTAAPEEPAADRALLAQWTFNESGLDPILRNGVGNAALDIDAKALLVRSRGVYGTGLDLSGNHALRTGGGPGVEGLPAITFSAWTRPRELGGYREIIRQEAGDRRLLFSFQADGTILSLGLGVGGYEECDASIDPARVMDGAWHHCAGTFDGQAMRVYLDGKQIGELERPGAIAVDPNAPLFLGSNSGASEHFQGGLDDVRVYREALSAEEIARLHERGQETLAAFARSLEDRLTAFYAPQESLARTLAHARRQLADGRVALDLDLANVLLGRLRSGFQEDFDSLAAWTGASPLGFLTARDGDLQAQQAERLVGMLLEYRPLTESQRAKQAPEDARLWEEADGLAHRLEALQAQGEAARFSPEWIELMLEAGRRIDFRPYQSEAVAPYVRPETPVTRDLPPEEARAALERDWLHQAGQDPSRERILAEIGWTRQLAERLGRSEPGELAALQREAEALSGPSADLYFRVREVKRALMFANPALDFTQILLVDMPLPQGSEWPHETRHRLGYMAVPGGRLLVLDGLSPAGKLTQLMPQAPLHGSFWRPDVSFDGRRVLFCFKPHNEKSFHLYEINADGSGLRQITDGPYDDLDPIYLPDGKHVVFSTTRAHTYVRCMPPTNAYVLARCDLQGRDIYLISGNNEPDYLPSVMNDGRLLYTRWEYTDKPLWRAQKLWTVNPDGTHVSLYWGNQSVWPDLVKDARSIPGSDRIMATGSAHHNWFAGSIALIDPSRGLNFPDGIAKVTADLEWPEVGNGPADPVESPDYHASGAYGAYYSPYPLTERDFLVSANRGGKFVLYLMDVGGNRELVYEGVNNILHAIPLRPRPRPPVIPDAVAWPDRATRLEPQDGVIYSNDVYDGAPAQLRGRARFLRVMAIDPKTYTYWHRRPYISTGPVVSMVQSEGVKRVLGTVPLEADGSVAFYAPPGKSLHFQLLDGQQRALHTMRSFVNVMPGERRGCLGCHELHSTAPAYRGSALALAHEPRKITPPPWEDTSVSYERYVQPVLDRYCGKCHQGGGEARKTLDLTRRPGYLMFDEPYVTLIGSPTWGQPYQPPAEPPPGFGVARPLMVEGYATTDPVAYQTPEPMTRLSYKSPLIDLVSSGDHHGVKVDEVSRLRLITWIDAMCPYLGDEEVRREPDPQFQGVDWLAIRPRVATAPVIPRPGPLD